VLLILGQRADAPQFAEEHVMFGMQFGWLGHGGAPLPKAGAHGSLSRRRLETWPTMKPHYTR
jgi:hypothetical protein